jgi:hypothetical protein
LFQQFHLSRGFFHKRAALGLRGSQQRLLSSLPFSLRPQGHNECVQAIFLSRVFFDERIRKQKTIRKHRHSSGIQMRRLARTDLQQFCGKHIVIQHDPSVSCNLNAVTNAVHLATHA